MFQFFIGDEEVICESKFNINEEFMNPSHFEIYKVYPKSWKGTNKLLTDYYFPEDYTECKILRDGELYFCGFIKNAGDLELNPFKPHYCSLQILSMSTLLSEAETLDYVIVNKTVEDAIKQVVDSISNFGFIIGNINIPNDKNTVIGAYSTLDKAPFDVFQYFSLISGTRWGTRMIDENTTAIDFYSPELLDTLGSIEVTKEYCVNNRIVDIIYEYSTTDYRNKQIITSDEVFANISQTEILTADGYKTVFSTEQKIGKIISISIDGKEKSFATKNDKDFGMTADFYYESGSNELESSTTLGAGIAIKIEYIPIVNGRAISYNNAEITRIANNLNRKGTISRYENRNDSTSSTELQSISDSYIKYKGTAEITINIVSKKDFLILGGKYKFISPINQLNKEYLVKTKKTNVQQAGTEVFVTYEYELTNSFDTENEINFFDNQRSKTNGNISQGEYISRNIDIENETNIVFSNLEIKELEILTDNSLQSGLQILL